MKLRTGANLLCRGTIGLGLVLAMSGALVIGGSPPAVAWSGTADLAVVSMRPSAWVVKDFSRVTYSVTIKNNGPDTAYVYWGDPSLGSLNVSDMPSAEDQFISASADADLWCYSSMGGVDCEYYKDIPAGATATLTFTWHVREYVDPGFCVPHDNTLDITPSTNPDPNKGNNSKTVTIKVCG